MAVLRAKSHAPAFFVRLPILLHAGIYALAYWLQSSQVSDVVSTLWIDGTPLNWASVVLAISCASWLQLLAIGARAERSLVADSVLATLPALAITFVMGRAVAETLYVMIPVAAIVLLGAFYLGWLYRASAGHFERLLIGVAGVGALAVAVMSVGLSPFALPTALGPLGVAAVAIGVMALLASAFASFPAVGTIVLLGDLAATFIGAPQREVALSDPKLVEAAEQWRLDEGLYAWLTARKDMQSYVDARRPYPVILVSAEGGGIYATAHSYLALSGMQQTCPNFAQHVFAAVGVSGGSLGLLLYAAGLEGTTENAALAPCHPRKPNVAAHVVEADLLSPVLANLLVLQLADFLWPGPQIFPDSGERLAGGLAAAAGDKKLADSSLRASWSPAGSRPALMFVATDVNRGSRFVMSALANAGDLTGESFPVNARPHLDISTAAAAGISARFPWVTNTARLRVKFASVRVLADGGYYENSGAETVVELSQQLQSLARDSQKPSCRRKMIDEVNACECRLIISPTFDSDAPWNGCDKHIFLAYVPLASAIRELPGDTFLSDPKPAQAYVADPLNTMLNARAARGSVAISRAQAYFGRYTEVSAVEGNNANHGFFQHSLPVDALGLPFGWKISSRAVSDVEWLSAATVACEELPGADTQTAKTIATEPRRPKGGLPVDASLQEVVRRDNGCNVAMLAWLFYPNHQVDDYAIEAW